MTLITLLKQLTCDTTGTDTTNTDAPTDRIAVSA